MLLPFFLPIERFLRLSPGQFNCCFAAPGMRFLQMLLSMSRLLASLLKSVTWLSCPKRRVSGLPLPLPRMLLRCMIVALISLTTLMNWYSDILIGTFCLTVAFIILCSNFVALCKNLEILVMMEFRSLLPTKSCLNEQFLLILAFFSVRRFLATLRMNHLIIMCRKSLRVTVNPLARLGLLH